MIPSALILAGSRPGSADPVALSEGVAHKALAEVGGYALLARVIAALRDAGVQRIAVSANSDPVVELARELGAEIVPPDAGPSGSVARGFELLGAPMLVTTADHALLQPEWVRQFVTDTPRNADVSVMLARREAVEAALPESRRTWLRFADGQWSGCNLFLLATPRAQNAIATWSQVEADRKRPWRIAARLGMGTLWSYLRGKLTLQQVLRRLGERIGVKAFVVAAADGLAAVDVDKVEDLQQVRQIVASRA